MKIEGLVQRKDENGGVVSITPKYSEDLFPDDFLEDFVDKVVKITIEVVDKES